MESISPTKPVFLPRTLLDKRRVRRWLMTFEPDVVVGKSCIAHSCPLAEHIKAEFAELEPTAAKAANFHIWLETNGSGSFFQRTPAWARRFIDLVDRPHGWTWKDDERQAPAGRDITAREALEIFDAITGV